MRFWISLLSKVLKIKLALIFFFLKTFAKQINCGCCVRIMKILFLLPSKKSWKWTANCFFFLSVAMFAMEHISLTLINRGEYLSPWSWWVFYKKLFLNGLVLVARKINSCYNGQLNSIYIVKSMTCVRTFRIIRPDPSKVSCLKNSMRSFTLFVKFERSVEL